MAALAASALSLVGGKVVQYAWEKWFSGDGSGEESSHQTHYMSHQTHNTYNDYTDPVRSHLNLTFALSG